LQVLKSNARSIAENGECEVLQVVVFERVNEDLAPWGSLLSENANKATLCGA